MIAIACVLTVLAGVWQDSPLAVFGGALALVALIAALEVHAWIRMRRRVAEHRRLRKTGAASWAVPMDSRRRLGLPNMRSRQAIPALRDGGPS